LIACVGDTAKPTPLADASTDVTTGNDGSTADAGSDVVPACGAPGTPCCNGTCNGGATCNAGSCACTAPTTACGTTCVNVQTDGKNCGTCGHDCLGGACTGGKCQPIAIATGQTAVNGVALDANGIYWTRSGSNSIAGVVATAKLDGTGLTPLSSAGVGESDYAPAVGGGYLYFIQTAGSLRAVWRCQLPSCNGGPSLIAGNQPVATDLALDAANNRLYWVNGTPYQGTGGAVMTMALPNGAPTRVVTADQPNPSSLALGSNGFVYWTNGGTYVNNVHQGNGGVRRAPLGQTNGAATTIVTSAGADVVGIALDAQSVYFGSGSLSTLEVAPINGGGSSSKLANVPGRVQEIAVDGTNVYWFESGPSGRILTCPRTGCPNGNPIVLAVNQDDPTSIAVDAVSVVWANRGGGEVRRLAK
jgi:hypothetical protein